MQNQPDISHHARERGKQRAGLDAKALERTAAKALQDGLHAHETTGRLRRYLDAIAREHKTTPRVHGNHVYFFGRENCLVTVIELPHEHRKSAASTLKKRAK